MLSFEVERRVSDKEARAQRLRIKNYERLVGRKEGDLNALAFLDYAWIANELHGVDEGELQPYISSYLSTQSRDLTIEALLSGRIVHPLTGEDFVINEPLVGSLIDIKVHLNAVVYLPKASAQQAQADLMALGATHFELAENVFGESLEGDFFDVVRGPAKRRPEHKGKVRVAESEFTWARVGDPLNNIDPIELGPGERLGDVTFTVTIL